MIELAKRYAAAFGMMAIGAKINTFFESDFEYVKLEVPDLEPLEFAKVLHGDKGNIFAPPLLMSFSQEKNLIETEVNDADPIIVERWGTKPWDITMSGLLIDLNNRIYPSDEIRRLNKNWQYNGVIKVVGKQFEERDIDTIYFRSIEFSGVEGYADTISVTINASSIRAVNFTLAKPKQQTTLINGETGGEIITI